MDLFDIIPENFFSILASKNKRLYLNCALEAFDVYEQGSILGIGRKIIVDDLVDYLEKNNQLYNLNSQLDDEEQVEKLTNTRELANYILRKLELCGWIYIDVTGDYQEILNFTDTAITLIEALITINPRIYYTVGDDDFDISQTFNANEYHGYIYTIYSLLNSADIANYGIVFNEIFKNTKQLIRSLRKIDSRMKDYINSVVEHTEIKDLMDKLVNYNVELFQSSYAKLKTSDNINKYQLSIVNHLENIQSTNEIMHEISKSYIGRCKDYNEATKRANRDVDEMIDIFKSLDEFISEIDYKNKTYINSTIGKIKFLLSEEDNIIGKLNTILKYIKVSNSNGTLEKALDTVRQMSVISSLKGYNDNSLYSPRGKYAHNYSQSIDLDRFDLDGLDESFINQFKNMYDEKYIEDFILANMKDNELKASDFINYDSSTDDVLLIIYSLLYAGEHNEFGIRKLDNELNHYKFSMSDFIIFKDVSK